MVSNTFVAYFSTSQLASAQHAVDPKAVK